jgi:hypothetical protein
VERDASSVGRAYNVCVSADLTDDEARRYVRQWAETGRLLEEQRWRALAELDPQTASAASDALIEAALTVPLPTSRRISSGLVAQQACFHRRTRR